MRIRLGPLTRGQYDRFLPGGPAHEALQTLTRFFTHDQFDVDVQLVLAQDEVPSCVIGGDRGQTASLGWCTWMRTGAFGRDADETVFTLSGASGP